MRHDVLPASADYVRHNPFVIAPLNKYDVAGHIVLDYHGRHIAALRERVDGQLVAVERAPDTLNGRMWHLVGHEQKPEDMS